MRGDLALIAPFATDIDNDAISYYFSYPFDTQGKWLTDYDDAGFYNVLVIASDGIDTVSQSVLVTINNTNRAPQVSLALSKYTVAPNEAFDITLSATDPDGDNMTFSLKKDNAEIASGTLTNLQTYTLSTSFTTIADHTITATVTDSQGLSATNSKGVDCADPNANRDSINPVMGDFNGDSLSDLGLHNSDTGTWEVAISDGGVFRNAVDWLSGFGTSKDWLPLAGDFNGDAKTDVAIYNSTSGELKIALSSGFNFSVSGTWLTNSSASIAWQPFTGNFNADRYSDFAIYNKDTGEVRVALGTGSGFGGWNTWLGNLGADYISLSGDFNGDSLAEPCLFKRASGEFKVAFSNSKAFVDGSIWITGFATDKDPILADFNNDGLTDIGYWDKSSGRWYYAISTGSNFIAQGLWLDNFGLSTDESGTAGDFDGNGITDVATFDKDQLGINRWTTRLSTDKPADLLTEVDNGIGGKTKVSYTYAARADNELLPFPVYVASTIALVNAFPQDRAATYTQNFAFSGGYYDAQEREFRGFAKVKVTDPITANFTETYFYQGKPDQDTALKGQIEKVIAFDGNARQISQTLNTYDVRKAGPESRILGFPALIEQTTTVFEENASLITTKDRFTYDNIGNLLEERDEGDTSKTGDERALATAYAQAYELGFNRPIETSLKDKDGNIVSKKNFEYDSKGDLIKESSLLFNPLTQNSQLITHNYTYDSFGNVISTTNPLGATTTTDYETTFYTYPEKITNALGHTIAYTYDARFGAVSKTTDPNGLITDYNYDSLGRLLSSKNSITSTNSINYTYPDFTTKISTNALGFTTTEYIDGLGRRYKTVSQGEDGALPRDIVTEVFYNNRGLTEKESLSHYIDEASDQISYIRYEYDIRGRIKKTISDFPGTLKDAESIINYISPLYTESIDPQGHRTGRLVDIYGNITEITEFTQEGIFKTTYEYDLQNNLTKTTDAKANITQIFYDSLGRKLKLQDPDMGTWAYEYDALGNLIKQTDAKGQILEFEYDLLNRLTRKLANSQTLVTYIYDDTNKPNSIGRLSKATDTSGSTEFFYDALGREIKSIKTVNSEQFTVYREYDILDRLTKLTYPDSEAVNYSYDSNSGLLEKVFNSTNSIDYVNSINYNAQGQIKTVQYGNGVTTDYIYGQDLRLSRISTIYNPSSTILQDLNYIFDKNGNITTLTDNLKSNIRTFAYDDLDRLTEAKNLPSPSGGYTNFYYQYDPIGNMTYKSDVGIMTYGINAGPHALTSAGGYSYQYDANGNMTQGKNKTLEYDIENRLIKVVEPTTVTTFTYDGDGGRVKKNSINSITQQTQETIYIGSLYEITQDSELITQNSTKHIFAGSNRICTVTSKQSTVNYAYYHPDHLGSSNIITDQNGNIVQSIEYTPYGSLAVNSITPQLNNSITHYFTGKELDNTGLYFYGARYYDPEIGRFITADPTIQRPYDPQDFNRYSYVRNNPINLVDPSGLGWKSFWKKLWHAIEKPFIAAATAAAVVFTWGAIAPSMTATAALFSKAGAAIVSSAAASTTALNTGEGRQFINRLSNEVFDDIFGMRPSSANIFGSISAYMLTNMSFQFGFARLYGANKPITQVKDYDPSKDKLTTESILREGKGINYGTRPRVDPQGSLKDISKILYSRDEAVGVATEALEIGGQPQHIGVVMKSLQIESNMAALVREPIKALSQGYLTFGISHQAVNISLINAGYNSTITSLGGGWSTLPSTFIYGPYGEGALGATTFEQIKDK